MVTFSMVKTRKGLGCKQTSAETSINNPGMTCLLWHKTSYVHFKDILFNLKFLTDPCQDLIVIKVSVPFKRN